MRPADKLRGEIVVAHHSPSEIDTDALRETADLLDKCRDAIAAYLTESVIEKSHPDDLTALLAELRGVSGKEQTDA